MNYLGAVLSEELKQDQAILGTIESTRHGTTSHSVILIDARLLLMEVIFLVTRTSSLFSYSIVPGTLSSLVEKATGLRMCASGK